jgi:hypothetical protein
VSSAMVVAAGTVEWVGRRVIERMRVMMKHKSGGRLILGQPTVQRSHHLHANIFWQRLILSDPLTNSALPLRLDLHSRERMTSLDSHITTHYASLPSPLPSSPSFVFHLTRLTNTLLIWVGTGQPTESSTSGEMIMPNEKKLAQDWAVAMPPRGVSTPFGTSGMGNRGE